ncbi:MAG: hypothetical protein LBT66_07970 [Methanobrevibacter sp.]|nr:hypothetical protein [Candidatus Methanovirga meridionalis]
MLGCIFLNKCTPDSVYMNDEEDHWFVLKGLFEDSIEESFNFDNRCIQCLE